MTFEPESLTTPQLLQYYYRIIKELIARKVVRTSNSPIGDYAEWLVANQLGLTLMENSHAGFDAEDSAKVKYQIKGRRITGINKSTQLGAIRNLEKHEFDYLIVVLFNDQVEVEKVLKIPQEIIGKYARYSEYVHAHILTLQNNILGDPLVEDITSKFHN